jgi:hypothetical protein
MIVIVMCLSPVSADKPLLFVSNVKCAFFGSGHAAAIDPRACRRGYFRGSGGQSTTHGHGPFCCCSRRVPLLMMVMVMVFCSLSSM